MYLLSMEITDFYGKYPKFKINGETLDGYCHLILNEIDSIITENETQPQYYRITKKELSSFNPQKELNPKIWHNGQLNSRIRMQLMDIATDFIKTLEVNWVKPKDIILTGSLANYNWSSYSDFDLHILIDFSKVDKRVDFVKDYFDSKKSLWNDEHDELTIYGFPVEVYVQDSNEVHNASGIYSLFKNKWLKIPSSDNFKEARLNKEFLKDKAIKVMLSTKKLYGIIEKETDKKKIEIALGKCYKLLDKLKGIRKQSLQKNGEMGIGNILYKLLRRNGTLDKLWDLKYKCYDKINSIN